MRSYQNNISNEPNAQTSRSTTRESLGTTASRRSVAPQRASPSTLVRRSSIHANTTNNVRPVVRINENERRTNIDANPSIVNDYNRLKSEMARITENFNVLRENHKLLQDRAESKIKSLEERMALMERTQGRSMSTGNNLDVSQLVVKLKAATLESSEFKAAILEALKSNPEIVPRSEKRQSESNCTLYGSSILHYEAHSELPSLPPELQAKCNERTKTRATTRHKRVQFSSIRDVSINFLSEDDEELDPLNATRDLNESDNPNEVFPFPTPPLGSSTFKEEKVNGDEVGNEILNETYTISDDEENNEYLQYVNQPTTSNRTYTSKERQNQKLKSVIARRHSEFSIKTINCMNESLGSYTSDR
ncbi:hypothetical protein M3Y94_00749900 [Aphelenchoides besseyi]|nr:hypothetical protein M3Y94_00749900 [Aphelenchoides besseyi]KAI6232062.1 hypothetical protein M3Y95_00447300 [Aphelenchoides besseyi]